MQVRVWASQDGYILARKFYRIHTNLTRFSCEYLRFLSSFTPWSFFIFSLNPNLHNPLPSLSFLSLYRIK
ncbi:hypothetical protein HanRHA438_Chr03g0106691 [Helianthus annuus]|nr:hypothetical protein HanRHA438_Chr03g0106691 [Helianthus annuus]